VGLELEPFGLPETAIENSGTTAWSLQTRSIVSDEFVLRQDRTARAALNLEVFALIGFVILSQISIESPMQNIGHTVLSLRIMYCSQKLHLISRWQHSRFSCFLSICSLQFSLGHGTN
jgi:hypothetical protein